MWLGSLVVLQNVGSLKALSVAIPTDGLYILKLCTAKNWYSLFIYILFLHVKSCSESLFIVELCRKLSPCALSIVFSGKEKEPLKLKLWWTEEKMVDVWWSLLGAAVPALVTAQALRMKRRRAEEQRIKSARGREKSSDDIFVCERVCTSKRMLKRVGGFSKDPTRDTCVTVCGVSELDACSDACARTVCVNQHQVPNWNDICLRRCQSECLKLSSSTSS